MWTTPPLRFFLEMWATFSLYISGWWARRLVHSLELVITPFLFRLRRRNFMLTLSLQPVAPTGFLTDWIGAHAVLSMPDAFLGTESSEMKSNNSNFKYFFWPLPPPLSCMFLFPFFYEGSQEEGQVLKMFHEIPEGKAVFAEHKKEKRFWPAIVSRNPREEKGFEQWQFHEIPEGKKVLNNESSAKTSKGKTF